jgi:DNA-binding transcriptional regulator YhcF (GntR family)
MPRRSKLRETLICQLLRRIEEHRRERHFVLPSIRAMAREQGVAYETMWRAVDQCRRRGLLTIVAGGKVRIGPKVSATEAKAAQPNSDVCVGSHVRGGTRLEQTTARLRDALTSGAYAQAPRLPPYKVLASEYGASYRVLRAALEVLAQEQLVEQCIGGFRRTRLAPPPRETNSVLLFTGALRGHQKHGFSFSRNNDLLRALEHASSTAGLRLIRVSIRPDSGEWLPHLHADRLKHVRGCLLWTQGDRKSVV